MKYFLSIMTIIFSFFYIDKSYSQKYVIITDVDDTIKITSVMARNKLFIENGIQTKAFYNMSSLFQLFIESKETSNISPDRNILYVTGAPGVSGLLHERDLLL